ncbi:MAG TPA: histidine phosphatase family protein, partial [Thermomonas sp.]|nr:histidine phosphatase family protein [Thermomonas sp.]
MKILLARHGETPWNAEGRYQGQVDIPLSEVGLDQAAALGQRLQDVQVDRAVASPLARATRTAQLALGEDRTPMLTFDDGLLEIAHGEWEGLLASEIAQRDPQRLQAWKDAPESVLMPGGESLQMVLERAWPALERACVGLGADDTLLVVAHDAVNRVLLARILGLPLAKLWGFRQAPATLN